MPAAQKSTSTPEVLDSKIAQAAMTGGASHAGEGVSVEKIRDILFGNQMQDYDRRFTSLEERVLQRIREVEAETTRSIGVLESATKKQVESFATQLGQEKDSRSDTDKELERSAREHIQTLEKRLGQVSDHLARVEREITDRIGQESQSLRDEMRRKGEELRNTIERMFSELSNVKTDRNLLAGLFVEIAKCLNQDLSSKGLGKSANSELPK